MGVTLGETRQLLHHAGARLHNAHIYQMTNRVYFFHNGSECKIGCSEHDLRRRLWAAHVWSPHPLEILGWIDCEPGTKFDAEKDIHLRLAHLRIVKPSGFGEWFNISKSETLQLIETYEGTKKHNHYSNAARHPAHTVRPLRRGQQNETAGAGKVLHNTGRAFGGASFKRVQLARCTEHAVSSQAFLR